MEFIIDNREKDIKEKLNGKEYLKFENLEVGDINIKYNGEIKIVIERKNIKDFSNSIKDGRYAEQKIRLKSLKLEPSNIYFLIEGKINKNGIMNITTLIFTLGIFTINKIYNNGNQ